MYNFSPASDFKLNCGSKSLFSEENHVFGHKLKPGFNEVCLVKNGCTFLYEGENSKEVSVPTYGSSPSLSPVEESSSLKENDPSDATLKFISEMLMEEDLGNNPCMLHDCLALQATEKSLYDSLNKNHDENDHFARNSSDATSFVESNWSHNYMGDFESFIRSSKVHLLSIDASKGLGAADANRQQVSSMNLCQISNSLSLNYEFLGHDSEQKNKKTSDYVEMGDERNAARDCSPNNSGEKKNGYREDGDFTDERRSNKQFANNISKNEPLEMHDNVQLCSYSDHLMQTCTKAEQSQGKKKSLQNKQFDGGRNRGRQRGGGKKQCIIKEVLLVDLSSLLMQCAQAVASFDSRWINDLLVRIRQHSSPQGDGTERVVHYFANALEARLAGTGAASDAAFNSKRTSADEIIKAYKKFITACPLKKISNFLANKTIEKLANGATTLHIIDFGIRYGYQWLCLIQALSERSGGPPKLRITGIDFPPAERVENTGRRLAKYCKRFRVPFEYNSIAQKWDTIRVEDLKIEKNELLVVNSMYQLHNVSDEIVMVNSPRDVVLNLIKKINPDMFIYGVVSGTYNTPFFITRFREALFHFSCMFDMFDATVPREDQNRLIYEQVFGRDAMNIIACEGTERIERPETYKQWQIRNQRAGFSQLPLDQEIVTYVRSKVKKDYHKDLYVDEDGKWMRQGWKGRVMFAISFWQPGHN